MEDFVQRGAAAGKVLTPMDVRDREVYLGYSTHLLPLSIGADIDEVAHVQGELMQMLDLFSAEEYLLGARTDDSSQKAVIHLLFKENVSTQGMLKGLFNAYTLRSILTEKGFGQQSSHETVKQKVLSAAGGKTRTEPLLGSWASTLVEESYRNIQEGGTGDYFASKLMSESKQGKSDENYEKDIENVWVVDGLLLESRVARVIV